MLNRKLMAVALTVPLATSMSNHAFADDHGGFHRVNPVAVVAGAVIGAAVVSSVFGPPRVYYAPPPVAYAPVPYYAPAPVYYSPAPYYYAPAPIYYGGPAVYFGGRWHHHHHR